VSDKLQTNDAPGRTLSHRGHGRLLSRRHRGLSDGQNLSGPKLPSKSESRFEAKLADNIRLGLDNAHRYPKVQYWVGRIDEFQSSEVTAEGSGEIHGIGRADSIAQSKTRTTKLDDPHRCLHRGTSPAVIYPTIYEVETESRWKAGRERSSTKCSRKETPTRSRPESQRSRPTMEEVKRSANLPAGIAWKPRNLHTKGRTSWTWVGAIRRGKVSLTRSTRKLDSQAVSIHVSPI